MADFRDPLTHRQTLYLILLPMLVTVVILRLYLHAVEIRHLYIAGHIFYHLFTGILLVIPSAFVLAFNPRARRVAQLARIVLGAGSGLILDEVIFLVATDRTAADYLQPLSLAGSVLLVSAAALLLLILYRLARGKPVR